MRKSVVNITESFTTKKDSIGTHYITTIQKDSTFADSIYQTKIIKDKIDLFLALFKGRVDVCAKRWKNKPGYSPYCYNDFKPGICNKPKIKCTECKNSLFAPLDEEQIKNHLLGKYVLGLYPMTTNDTCFLLAMDFDESTWGDDIKVVIKV